MAYAAEPHSAPADLHELWVRRLAVIAANVANGERQHRELANIASHIGADYHGRFVIELLQNASDQATQAGLTASTVSIVRTSDFLAIANQGRPFDPEGVESVTSLGLSQKDAGVNLGNKGVGFKAVFEISRSPEIYSAGDVSHSFERPGGYYFRLDIDAFSTSRFEAELRQCIESLLLAQPDLAHRLRERTGRGDPIEVLVTEARFAPPWKFPIGLGPEDLDSRLASLDLPHAAVSDSQTLIVLPLLQGGRTGETTDRALDELRESGGSGILFLPAVHEIALYDRTRGVEERISRRALDGGERLSRGAMFKTVETSIRTASVGMQPRPGRRWWIASRTLGGDENAGPCAAAERESIRAAAARLPGEGWAAVDYAKVSVALPQPDPSGPRGFRLSADGLFCIGLPTKVQTGMPFWVDGHFHGTLSRTTIDLATTDYNRILFDEAIALAGDLVVRLKRDPKLRHRRAVTLAFERSHGPLADRVWEQKGLARSDIVLSADGLTYMPASSLALPAREDMDVFAELAKAVPDVSQFGFRIAEPALMRCARDLLELLSAVAPSPSGRDVRYLRRPEGHPGSLLELAAAAQRRSGRAFWERFLRWVVERFPPESLQDQRFLPVGDDELARPNDNVFLAPRPTAGRDDRREEDEIDVGGIPADVRRMLRFLDERAVKVRKGPRRDVTELAGRLAPDSGPKLVRRPRIEDLLDDAVAPRLVELSQDRGNRPLAMALLRQAVEWVRQLPGKSQGRLNAEGLRVPAAGDGDEWVWVAPTRVYFGDGWLGEPENGLLGTAYGGRVGGRLVPWTDFAVAAEAGSVPAGGGPEPRDWWTDGMRRIGVADAPRFVEPAREVPALVARSYAFLSIENPRCPYPGSEVQGIWTGYVETIRHRRVAVASGQRYELEDVCWIDGLDDERSRRAVLELVLRRAARYEQRISTQLARAGLGTDRSHVPTLWVHALRTSDWPVIPTESAVGGTALLPPGRAWWLSPEERRKEYVRLLPSVIPELSDAARLLRAIGVATLDDAPVERLIDALHRVAAVPGDALLAHMRAALALSEELYRLLDERCRQGASAQGPPDLSILLQRPVPLVRGRNLVAASLLSKERIYFDDDPVRAPLVEGYDHACRLPRLREASHLLEALRRLLGADRVVRTSEAPVFTGFTQSPARDPMPLMDFLERRFEGLSVAVDLGVLLAYGGRGAGEPSKETFRESWARFGRAVLHFGRFATPAGGSRPLRSFYDPRTDALQVDEGLEPHDVVEATWAIAGQGYRDLWSAYARDLATGQTDRFFAERQIGVAERLEVETSIGRGPSRRYLHVLPALLAIWRSRHQEQPVQRFEDSWPAFVRTPELLAQWLGRPELHAALAQARELDEESGSLRLLAAAQIPVAAWQRAREELGRGRWGFSASERLFLERREELVAGLMCVAARSRSVSLDAARGVLASLKDSLPDAELVEHPADAAAAIAAVLGRARAFLGGLEDRRSADVIGGRLVTMAGASADDWAVRLRDLGPRREVWAYRDEPEAVRSQQAQAVVADVLHVAVLLARSMGETVDPAAIAADARVAALRSGWWANPWSVLPALQHALESTASRTAARLSDARAFTTRVPLSDLWAQFPELGVLDAPTEERKRPKIRRVFGQEVNEDDLTTDLARGSQGAVGEKLQAAALETLDFSAFRTAGRSKVEWDTGASARRARGNWRSASRGHESQRDQEVNGWLGEAFVYEQLRRLLPDFTEFAWVSKNRTQYGFSDTGSDEHGCDFLYRDVEGRLTGRDDQPECCIEVKATSTDASGPFPMSVPEWERALECHGSETRSVYIIVRISDVNTTPRVTDILFDAVGMFRRRELAISGKDLWVAVGMREACDGSGGDSSPEI